MNEKHPLQTASFCRLRQALFYTRTGKPIVVIDRNDLESLVSGMPLPTMLSHKIRAIEQLHGLSFVEAVGEDLREIDLPNHLKDAVAK